MSGVEIDAFLMDLKKIKRQLVPKAVVKGFSRVAKLARNNVRARTRALFKLHSEFVPRSIIALPIKRNQMAAAEKAFSSRYKDLNAYVILGKKAEFMKKHEYGTDKRLKESEVFAIPGPGLKKYSYKSAKTGRPYKRWRPKTILQWFNETDGKRKPGRHEKGKPKAFIMQRKGIRKEGMIVRRITKQSRDIQILYFLSEEAHIKPVWGFVKTVHKTVKRHIHRIVIRELERILKNG